MKVEFQCTTDKYTLLGFKESIPLIKTEKVKIDGRVYKTEIVYDLPNHIAVIGIGNFVGKEIEFNV